MIILKMDYCNSCGDCCFYDCKGKDGKCHVENRHEVCDSFPIMEVTNNYFLGICKGIINNKLPVSFLENIIIRLNNGENNIEIKSSDFYFLKN